MTFKPIGALYSYFNAYRAFRNLQLNAHQDSAHTERDNANFSHVAIEISSFPQAGSAAGVRDGNPSGHTAHSGGVGGRRVSNGTEVPKSGGPLDSVGVLCVCGLCGLRGCVCAETQTFA